MSAIGPSAFPVQLTVYETKFPDQEYILMIFLFLKILYLHLNHITDWAVSIVIVKADRVRAQQTY
jgi:hypothetical protein